LSQLTKEQEALIGLIREWPDCHVIITVRDGQPAESNTPDVMIPLPANIAPVDHFCAGEMAVIAACKELGYGYIEMDIAGHMIMGWHIGTTGCLAKGQIIKLSHVS
jgi:hypothetical protein